VRGNPPIHQLKKANLSVAISASQVEALCQLKRDLIDNGVPEQEIGLVHSYKFDPAKIGEDDTPACQRPRTTISAGSSS
jgi:hypothetical protein